MYNCFGVIRSRRCHGTTGRRKERKKSWCRSSFCIKNLITVPVPLIQHLYPSSWERRDWLFIEVSPVLLNAYPDTLSEFMIWLGLLFGPPLTMWYTVLNRIKSPSPAKGLMYRVRGSTSYSNLSSTVTKNYQVFLDQALFAPGNIFDKSISFQHLLSLSIYPMYWK